MVMFLEKYLSMKCMKSVLSVNKIKRMSLRIGFINLVNQN